MTMTISAAAARLGRNVRESEDMIERALLSVAELAQSTMLAQINIGGASAASSQAALLRVHKTMGELIDARGEVLRFHGDMLGIAREMNVTEEPTCPSRSASLVGDSLAA